MKKQKLSFLVILSALMAFTSLSTDIYLPAMPAMQGQLGGKVALTVTGFLIGFSIAQLIWGPISDRIGRKKPLFIGIILFLVGSIGCSIATSMTQIIIWRIVQAVGACVGPMLSRTMIRDLYVSSQAAEMLSTLMIIMSIAPIIAPLIGGFLLNLGSWRFIFWVMTIIAAIMLWSVSRLPETLSLNKRSHGPIKNVFKNYAKLLSMPSFMTYTLSVTFFYVAIYAFITGSSDVYISYFHVNPQLYGLFFGVNIIGVSMLSMVNRQLVNRFSLSYLMKGSTTIALIFAIVLFFDSLTGFMGIWGIVVPMFFVFSMNGIIAACSNAAALGSVSDEIAGSAAALIGALQYGSGIISSALLAIFADGTPNAMTFIIAISVFLATIMAWISKDIRA